MFLRLAWRNVWRNRARAGIVFAAVAVGMAGVVLSMALNNGLVFQMVENAIATEVGHLQVHARGYSRNPGLELRLRDGGEAAREVLRSLPEVRAWAPRVVAEGLLFSPRASAGVRVFGVDPGREAGVSLVARSIVAGRYLEGKHGEILVGEVLARRLRVGVGEKVVLSVQDAAGNFTGGAFRISGLFRSPAREFDRGTVFLDLGEARDLLGIGGDVSEIVVLVRRESWIPRVRRTLQERLGEGVEVRTWGELRPLLLQMVELFDQTAWYVYAAVFLAMVFGIANVLLVSVYERLREFGILLSVGMRPRRLVAMIVTESLLLTLAGVAAGYGAAAWVVSAFHEGIDLGMWAEGLRAAGVGTRLVPFLRAYDFVVPLILAFASATGASLWPAWRAARLEPAEALRSV
ncbi:MAG: ABC transporter permease [Candidatus Binatia bacterium]|nr:MAG: ABC transporter permease [Candidatus Binatia bacterium]